MTETPPAGCTGQFRRRAATASVFPFPGPDLATWSTTHVLLVRAVEAVDQWVASGYLSRVEPDSAATSVNWGEMQGWMKMLLISGVMS